MSIRSTDEGRDKHPEALRRERERRLANTYGFSLMGFGALTIALPIMTTGDINAVPALAGIAIMLMGGLVRDRETFMAITNRIIDALPGGKS